MYKITEYEDGKLWFLTAEEGVRPVVFSMS